MMLKQSRLQVVETGVSKYVLPYTVVKYFLFLTNNLQTSFDASCSTEL